MCLADMEQSLRNNCSFKSKTRYIISLEFFKLYKNLEKVVASHLFTLATFLLKEKKNQGLKFSINGPVRWLRR